MVGFIDAHRDAHGVEPICAMLPIAPSTYYDHLAKRADPARLSDRARSDEALRPEIRRVFEENWRVYGVRKVWHQLRREGFDAARCTVARLMKDIGIQGIIRGKPHRTTIPDKKAPCPLDKVNRQFRVSAPNMLWVSDFTYVATWKGFAYPAQRFLEKSRCAILLQRTNPLGDVAHILPIILVKMALFEPFQGVVTREPRLEAFDVFALYLWCLRGYTRRRRCGRVVEGAPLLRE